MVRESEGRNQVLKKYSLLQYELTKAPRATSSYRTIDSYCSLTRAWANAIFFYNFEIGSFEMVHAYYSTYLDARREVCVITEIESKEDLELYILLINELTNLWFKVFNNQKDQVEPLTWITSVLTINKIILTLNAHFNLNLEGHYTEATLLQRTLIEDLECLLFFHYFPERTQEWINEKIEMKEIVCELNKKANHINKLLRGIPEIKGKVFSPRDLQRPYSNLSKYVHSSRTALQDFIITDNDYYLSPQVKLHPIYNPTISKQNIITCLSLVGIAIYFVKSIFAHARVDNDLNVVLNRLTKKLEEYPKRLGL